MFGERAPGKMGLEVCPGNDAGWGDAHQQKNKPPLAQLGLGPGSRLPELAGPSNPFDNEQLELRLRVVNSWGTGV